MSIRSIPIDLETGAPADQETRRYKTFKWLSSFPGSLTVRESASEYGRAKWYIQQESPVRILGVKGDYYRIGYGKHQEGYVDARFLRRC